MSRLMTPARIALIALIASLLAVVPILGYGCGGDDGSSAVENGDANGGNGNGGDGGGPSGPTLYLAGDEPLTLDPANAGDATSATYVVEIFGGLVTIDKDLKIAPDIAERWDISPDGKVYTFYLRQDVMFHYTNRVVTADDFKYSMERTADPDTASLVAEAYLGDIVGAKERIRSSEEEPPEISGIRVIDNFTLAITIDQPKPYFLAKLTYPTAFVVDRQQVESNPRNWLRQPHGTGPYMVDDWTLGEQMVFKANERYHLGAPQVKSVEYLLSGGSVLTMYEDDELDIAGVGINDIERVLDPSDPLHDEYVTADDLSISYLGFNVQQEPFDDANVRRAFGAAIDKERIGEVLLMNMLPVAHSIMPPGLPGYNPDAKTVDYNPEEAQRLLEESKYGGRDVLPELTITEIGGGATAGVITQAVVEMWKDVLGVDVEIQQTEEATFWQDLDAGRFQMFTAGWIMDYPDPEDILDILFSSTSRQNSSRYSNPEVDALLVQARTEADVATRMGLYQQAEQMILEDAPWIPLFNGRGHVVVKPYVKGYVLPAMVIPQLRYITIEE